MKIKLLLGGMLTVLDNRLGLIMLEDNININSC